MLANDGKVSNSINSLEQRCNMVCVSLFYRSYNRFFSIKINGLIPENHVVLRNTWHSLLAYPYVVDCPVDRAIPYGQNSFFSRTNRMWNSLRTEIVIFWLIRDEKGVKYRKIITGVCK